MKKLLTDAFSLINSETKIQIYLIIFLTIFISFIETIGLGLLTLLISILNDSSLFFSKLESDFFNYFLPFFDDENYLTNLILIIFIFYIFKGLVTFLFFYFFSRIRVRLQSEISNSLYKKYINQNYNFFLDISNSKLVNNVLNESIRFNSIIFSFVNTCKDIFLLLLLVFGILIIDLSNSIFVFVFIFLISASIYKILKNKLVSLGQKKTKYNIYLLKNLSEFFNGIKQIKILNLEKILEFEFSKIIKSLLKVELIIGYIIPLPRLILEVVGVSGILLVIVLFVNNSGSFNQILPSITFISLATIRMIPAFASINNNLNNVLSNLISAEIINNDMKLRIQKKKKSKEIKNFKNLKIKNLNFSFRNKKIFNNVNLNLKKNDIVGIIGSSGSGKTTLADLILGLLKPNNGKIIFNNKFDLKNYQFSRDFFGYVPQDVFLLNESIKNNLIMGIKKNINKKKIDEVLEITELKNLISNLPDGIDTLIGDRGSKISGGQRQRIGIARSLLQDPQFLILDESTSSLDHETEKKVLNRILNLNNKTIILITHRKNILKNCNKIFSLSDNKLRKIR